MFEKLFNNEFSHRKLIVNISEALQKATEKLIKNNINEPRREANSLLSFALGKDKTFLIAHSEYQLSESESENFRKLLERRANREPLQYIRGTQEFFGLDFIVTPDVLIPRPETELLVEAAIEILETKKNARFCEIGTGSGCISVSILREVKSAYATGADISEKALEITKLNAERNSVFEKLKLIKSDVFESIENEKFDLIVSNPPYISIEDFQNLQSEVKNFEPQNALTDNKNGLSIIEKIISDAPKFLKSDCYLLMEIGYDQSAQVEKMFDLQTWQSVEFLRDLQGIRRTVKAKLKQATAVGSKQINIKTFS